MRRCVLRLPAALSVVVWACPHWSGCGFEAGLPATGSVNLPSGNSRPGNGGGNTAADPADMSDLVLADLPCVDARGPTTFNHNEMFQLLNDYRSANGLDVLVYSRVLQQAADDYAVRMYEEGFFDHVAPDGSTAGDRAGNAGFCHVYVGENLAYGLNGATSAAEAMEGFRNSPGHNSNMLRAEWDYVGVGFYTIAGPLGREYWWVQLFAQDMLRSF